jgi:hypothetical protein
MNVANDGTNKPFSLLRRMRLRIIIGIDDYVSPFCRKQYKSSWVFVWSARYCCMFLNKSGVTRKIFIKVSDINFHENHFQREPLWHMRTNGQTDMMKLTDALCCYATAPKKHCKSTFLSIVPDIPNIALFEGFRSSLACSRKRLVLRRI